MKLLRSVVALSLLAAAGVSQADVQVNWGQHDALEKASQFVESGVFSDIYSFSLAPQTLNDLTSSAVSLENKDLLDIVGGKVDLYAGVFGDDAADTWLGGFSFAGNTGANEYFFEGLTSGNYFYRVSGDATTGSLGGAYLFSSSLVTAPVPEPETYAMLAAGLGAIVVARRSKKKA